MCATKTECETFQRIYSVPQCVAGNKFGLRADDLRNEILIEGVALVAPLAAARQHDRPILRRQRTALRLGRPARMQKRALACRLLSGPFLRLIRESKATHSIAFRVWVFIGIEFAKYVSPIDPSTHIDCRLHSASVSDLCHCHQTHLLALRQPFLLLASEHRLAALLANVLLSLEAIVLLIRLVAAIVAIGRFAVRIAARTTATADALGCGLIAGGITCNGRCGRLRIGRIVVATTGRCRFAVCRLAVIAGRFNVCVNYVRSLFIWPIDLRITDTKKLTDTSHHFFPIPNS